MSQYKKDFDAWNNEKKSINQLNKNKVFFHEREIWRCKVGVNVGFEIDGKKDFLRPVLILKKLSRDTFIGAPLTKKDKDIIKEKGIETLYFKLGEIKDNKTNKPRDDLVSLQQIRIFDKKRLISKKYRLKKTVFNEIKKRIRKLI